MAKPLSPPTAWTTGMVRDLEHLTNPEFAEKYGVTINAIKAARTRYKKLCPRSRLSLGGRKFFAEDVAWMFEQKMAGKTYREIGEEINRTAALVRRIMTRAAELGYQAYPTRESLCQ